MCPVSYTVVYCVELWCACHVSILQVMLVLYLWVLYTVCVSCVWLQPSPLILCFDVSCGKVCISEHLYVHDAFMRMMWTKRLKGLIFRNVVQPTWTRTTAAHLNLYRLSRSS